MLEGVLSDEERVKLQRMLHFDDEYAEITAETWGTSMEAIANMRAAMADTDNLSHVGEA